MGGQRVVSVVYYSQTGQLREAAEAFTVPLAEAGWQIDWVEAIPVYPYPFPWPAAKFGGIFPEAADTDHVVEVRLKAPVRGSLVVFAFQVWYLAPSLPMRSVPRAAPDVLRGRDVIALVACRNMWYSAAVDVQGLVEAAGGIFHGTVAATDTHPTPHTVVTTLHWLLTGSREPFGPFPRAGVTDSELARLRAVGQGIAAHGPGGLAAMEAAPIVPVLAGADLLSSRVFRRLSRIIRTTSRPGTLTRHTELAAVGGIIVALLTVGVPLTGIARLLSRKRFDAAVARRLAPALGPTVPTPEKAGPR